MNRLPGVLRGLAHRRAAALLILAVALIATATAATGPLYYAAAKISIMRDGTGGGGPLNRGLEATGTGTLQDVLATMQSQVDSQLSAALGPGPARRLFAAPIRDLETQGTWSLSQGPVPVDWRAGVCGHLQIAGQCPHGAGQVIISRPEAVLYSLHPGERLHVTGWPPLTVTGIYRIPAVFGDYWFGRAQSTYFQRQYGGTSLSQPEVADALFTSLATMQAAPAAAQGTGVLSYPLRVRSVTTADVPVLQTGINALVNSVVLQSWYTGR